jgi:hypothetical protein
MLFKNAKYLSNELQGISYQEFTFFVRDKLQQEQLIRINCKVLDRQLLAVFTTTMPFIDFAACTRTKQ